MTDETGGVGVYDAKGASSRFLFLLSIRPRAGEGAGGFYRMPWSRSIRSPRNNFQSGSIPAP